MNASEFIEIALRTGLPMETSLDRFPELKAAAASLGASIRMEPDGDGITVHVTKGFRPFSFAIDLRSKITDRPVSQHVQL